MKMGAKTIATKVGKAAYNAIDKAFDKAFEINEKLDSLENNCKLGIVIIAISALSACYIVLGIFI